MNEELLYELVGFFRRYVEHDVIDPEYEYNQAENLLDQLEEIAESI